MKVLSTVIIIILMLHASESGAQKFTVHFTFNSAEISAAETARLDSFVQSTQKLPMTVSGYTDSHGSNSYNDALSKRRADAVKNYLTADGFSVRDEQAFGETKPVVRDNGDTIIGAANRRVEIIFDIPEESAKENNIKTSEAVKPITDEHSINELLANDSLKKGSLLVLQNIYFIGGRHLILPSSRPQLESLLNALRSNPKLKISIEGHICCLPGDQDGIDFDTELSDLSYQRAKAINDYLVNAGIDQGRLSFKGLGHKFPIYPYPEKSPEEQTANRSVEVRIVEK